MYCRHCGKELKENASFCSACGTPRGTTRQHGAVSDTAMRSVHRNKHGLIGLGAAVILIGIIAGIIMITPLGNTARRHLKSSLSSEPEFRVSRRTFIQRDGLTTEEEFSYDAKGRLTETHRLTEYKDDSGEVQTEDYRESITYISDSDTLYIKTVKNAADSDENGKYQKVVHDTLNEKDSFVTRDIEDYDGTHATINATYEYHPNGELSKYVHEYSYSDEKNNNLRYKQDEATYDENGKVIHSLTEWEDGDITENTYTRTPDGTLITREYANISSSYTDSRLFNYDEYGNESSETFSDGTVCQYDLSLDSEGRVLRKVHPQTKSADGTTPKLVFEYQYDDNGNECYMNYEYYEIDSDIPDDWSYEVYTEYVRV